MTAEVWVIGAVRVLGALPVLRWPLAGAVIAILVDFADLLLMGWLQLGGLGDYQQFDKIADLAYMATFLIVALRWQGLARRIAVGLFALRVVGLVGFTLTDERLMLLAFPNVFELWFVAVAARDHYAPEYRLTARRAAGWLALVAAAKLGQEYVLHAWRVLDNYVAVEVVRELWEWLRQP